MRRYDAPSITAGVAARMQPEHTIFQPWVGGEDGVQAARWCSVQLKRAALPLLGRDRHVSMLRWTGFGERPSVSASL